ncbi:hypothetical protein Chor_005506 [Crotalus horridus]
MEEGKWYGVRSYLHLFYEDCTGTHSEDNLENAATSPTKAGWTPVFWKVRFFNQDPLLCGVFSGTLLMLTGAAALTTGSLLPSRLEDIGEAEFVVLDQRAVDYNGALDICRAVGVVLCAVAGVLLAASVVLSRIGRRNRTGYPGDNGKEEQLSPILQENAPHPWGAIVSATPAPFQVYPAKSYPEVMAPYAALPSHPNIARVAEVIVGDQNVYVFFEPGKDNMHDLVRRRKRVPESEAVALFRQMAEAVAHCHQHGIVLRDIKLRKFVFADWER